tara:strand:+ start:79 stop:1017 length:939 start_codon:yes stop_codon:yes gene_type:complete
LEESIRQFGVGQDWQERQFGELSAAQLAQQAQDQARIDEQTRQFGVGQDWQERQFGELSEAQQQDLAIQQLGAGIDPETNQYLGFDPTDPYAAFSPQQQYQAMQENQQPIVALLPMAAAAAKIDPSVIGELISTLQTGAMGQPLTDEMVISALVSSGDPELQGLIQMLLSLQQEDWRTGAYTGATGAPISYPGGVTPAVSPPTITTETPDSIWNNPVSRWLDPAGHTTGGPFDEGGMLRSYWGDPRGWITPSDMLRQNRAWGNEGSPIDQVGDFGTSVVGRAVSFIDPFKWTERGGRFGAWALGIGDDDEDE